MAKRRLGKGFKVPGENEGFVDYMLRRATRGGFDKRDGATTDQSDEENSSDDKSKKSAKTKRGSDSSASKVSSSDVTKKNDNFAVISSIQTMTSVLGVKLDDISFGIKESNQALGSINKYSEDSSIWLAEIYDLLDTGENNDRKGKNSDAKLLSSSDVANGPSASEEAGGGGLLSLAAGAGLGSLAAGETAAGGAALAGETAAGGALAGETAVGGGALVAAAPLAGAALAVGATIAVPMVAQKLSERDKEEILKSRGQIISSDPQAIQDIKDALDYQIKQNADIADPTQNYDDLFTSLKSSISDVVGPLSSAGKISEMAINTIILQKAREIMANAGKNDVHLSEDFDRSIQYIDAIPLDSRNEKPVGMGGHHPDSGTDFDGASSVTPSMSGNLSPASFTGDNSMTTSSGGNDATQLSSSGGMPSIDNMGSSTGEGSVGLPTDGPGGTVEKFGPVWNELETKHGLPSGYMQQMAKIESNFDPNAHNPSGAAGLFQFMPGTAREYGLSNPYDPMAASQAAAQLASNNSKYLQKRLDRMPTAGELYLAHQQGAGGAAKLLSNPDAMAVSVIGRQPVIQNGGNESMTAGQFANLWTSKFGGSPAVSSGGKPNTKTVSSNPSIGSSGNAQASSKGKSSTGVATAIGAVGKLAGNLIGNLSKSTSLKSAAPQVAAASNGGSGGPLASTGSSSSKTSKLPTGGSSNPLPAIDNMFAKLFDESAMFG